MTIEKRMIRDTDTRRAAKKALATRTGSFKISQGQAKAILSRRSLKRS